MAVQISGGHYINGNTAYTITGNEIRLFDFNGAQGGVMSRASANQLIEANVRFSDSGNRSAFIVTRVGGSGSGGGGGNLTLSNVEIAGSVTELRLSSEADAGRVRITGTLSGSNKPIVVGRDHNNDVQTSTFVELSGENTYSGGTTFAAGTLRLGHDSALGSGKLTIDGTVNDIKILASTDTSGRTLANDIDLFNNLTIGQVQPSGGTGSLTFTGNVSMGTSSGTRTLTVNGDHTFEGVISGGRGIVKQGTGTLVLSGANTFTGTTTVEAGVIRLGQAGASFGGATSAIRLGADGSIDLNGHSTTVRYVSERGSSDGGIVNLGSGTLTIQDNGDTTRFQSSINGTGGNLVYDSASTSVMSLYNAQGWTGTTTVRGGTLTSAGSMQTSSIAIEGGVFRLTSSNNRLAQNPNITLSGGAFNPRTNETIKALNASGGTLELGTSEAGSILTLTADSSIAANVALRRGTLRVDSGTLTYSSSDSGNTTAIDLAGGIMIIPDNASARAQGITVGNGARLSIGGGSLTSNLLLGDGSTLEVDLTKSPLSVIGTISFGSNFGIGNLAGFDWDGIEKGTYTLFSTDQGFDATALSNFGFENRVAVGENGREAYFQTGSLQLVVIPEPSLALLGSLGMLSLLRRRRAGV